MTALEAVKDYQYDVSICMDEEGLWYWDINGGYSSVSGRNSYPTAAEAESELYKYLETFKPFEK